MQVLDEVRGAPQVSQFREPYMVEAAPAQERLHADSHIMDGSILRRRYALTAALGTHRELESNLSR